MEKLTPIITSTVDNSKEFISLSANTIEKLQEIASGVDQNEIRQALQGFFNAKAENIGMIALSSPIIGLYVTLTTIMARGVYADPTIQEGLAIICAYGATMGIAFNRNSNAHKIAQKSAEKIVNNDLLAALKSENINLDY